MSVDANKAAIYRLFDEVWGRGDVPAASRFYAAGPTLDALQEFATALYLAFPDWRATIDDVVAEDDKVVVRWTGRGTHRGDWFGTAATNREIEISGIDVERFVDGLIAEEHGNVDMLGFMQQIGAVTSSEKG